MILSHHEFQGYFQENEWRISDNLVVLIAAAVCIQSYASFPGRRNGILWKWKQPCRRQCTVWITCLNTWRKGKLCLEKMPGRTIVQLLLWTAQVIKLYKSIDWHMFHQALALQSSPIKNMCILWYQLQQAASLLQILNSQRLKWKLSQDDSQISFNLHKIFPLCLNC